MKGKTFLTKETLQAIEVDDQLLAQTFRNLKNQPKQSRKKWMPITSIPLVFVMVFIFSSISHQETSHAPDIASDPMKVRTLAVPTHTEVYRDDALVISHDPIPAEATEPIPFVFESHNQELTLSFSTDAGEMLLDQEALAEITLPPFSATTLHFQLKNKEQLNGETMLTLSVKPADADGYTRTFLLKKENEQWFFQQGIH